MSDEWQTIDNAPDDGQPVWIWPPYDPDVKRPQLVRADGDAWRYNKKQNHKFSPRYWMSCEVPKPPAEGTP